jgi:hypothetical protein
MVTVENDTGEAWPAGVSIYVYAPSKTGGGAGLVEVAAKLADHEARITALEGGGAPASRGAKGRK